MRPKSMNSNAPPRATQSASLLPRLEEEAPKPTSPVHNTADRPPRGYDREASRPSTQAAPRRRSKNTKARENVPDLQDILEDKARQTRSIYGSRGRPMIRDDNRRAGHSKSGRAEQNRKALLSSIVISPNTEAPHTHYASQMK